MYLFIPIPTLYLRANMWTVAIREGFVMLLPLTLIGAMANVLIYFPLPGYVQLMHETFGDQWSKVMNLALSATMGIMGIASAIVISMRLTNLLHERVTRADTSLPTVAAISAAAFLLVVLPANISDQNLIILGYSNIFEGLIVGVLTAEFMFFASRMMPRSEGLSGLESSISLQDALRSSIQAVLVLATVYGLYEAMLNVLPFLQNLVLMPLLEIFNRAEPGPAVLNLMLVLVNQLFWLVGINGGQLLLHLGASGNQFLASPDVMYSASQATPSFANVFAHLGGAGSTWGLILACIIWGKDAGLRKLALISMVPALLNVNELLLFGIPIVFGRALLVPFLLAPMVNMLIAVIAVQWVGLPMTGQPVVWSTPILISGYLMTGSLWGIFLQVLCLACSVAIYLPFVRLLEGQRARLSRDAMSSALKILLNPKVTNTAMLNRQDRVGDIARGLKAEFLNDLHTERVFLAYQPKHDIRGRLISVEGLLRWCHAVHGMIPPPAIVNIAEECELIHDIGKWVLDTACADLIQWRKEGITDISVGINMSPLQLEHPKWIPIIRETIATHKIKPEWIDLEITEGRELSSSEVADTNLATLEAMQFKLSMDDFGMGCTSLLYMQRFQMYSIKLDGQITRNVTTNRVNQEIIRAICRLGESQGVKVVAEFVEKADQRDLLASLGCDYFQGWLYSPALPAKELLAYARASKK